jgi:hypothetical protein
MRFRSELPRRYQVALLSFLLLAFCTFHVMAQSASAQQPAAQPSPPMLHVEGKQLRTLDGRVVRLQGVSIPSLEWSNQGEQIARSVAVALDDWRSNCVRIPLSQDRWFGMEKQQSDGGAAYRKIVDGVVNACARKGAYAVLDLHWSNGGQWQRFNRQFKMPDLNSTTFWLSLAERYKNHPAVLFDLYNEPRDVSWDIWKNGGTVTEEIDGQQVTYQTPGLQKLIDVIRATGAHNIVVAGGLDWGYDLSGVANGYALIDAQGNGVMYGTHIYPSKGTQPEKWDPHVRIIADKYPILVGEVGCEPDPQQEDPLLWAPKIIKYMDDLKLNWTAWSFHPSATPRLLTDWTYTPTPYWGVFVKQALADNKPVFATVQSPAPKVKVAPPKTGTQNIAASKSPAPKAVTPKSVKPKSVASRIATFRGPTPQNSTPGGRPLGVAAFRDEMSTYNTAWWRKSGPYANNGVFRNAWHPDNITHLNGVMTLRLDDKKSSNKDFTGAEIGTVANYGYGRIEARMKPAKASGVITALFTYIGAASNSARHEIDIEFLGNDTTKLDIGYYTNGKLYDPGVIDLGFDAAEAFHTYAFEWTAKSIKWFVDGKLVHTETGERDPLPSIPGQIMANLWATVGADGWAGPFNYSGKPITAQYDWIRYTPLRPDGSPAER